MVCIWQLHFKESCCSQGLMRFTLQVHFHIQHGKNKIFQSHICKAKIPVAHVTVEMHVGTALKQESLDARLYT